MEPTPAPSNEPASKPTSSGVTLILQELTYALWEWVVITIGGVLSTALTYFLVSHGDQHDFIIYGVAAMICLTPIAYVVDFFYRKREPQEHHGFGTVIFVINAVLVFLSALGGAIGAVIALLTLIVDSGDATSKQIGLIVALVYMVLNAGLFIRIIGRKFAAPFLKLFPIILAVLAVVSLVLGIVGPIKQSYVSKQDRLIEDNLSTIDSDVRSYYSDMNVLPDSLATAVHNTNSEEGSDVTALLSSNAVGYSRTRQDAYELCVTYKASRGNGRGASTDSSYSLDTYDHPAGHVCYHQTVSDDN